MSAFARKIDPARRAATGGAAGGGNPALAEWAAAGLEAPDMEVVRRYRLERLRAELRRRDVAGALLYDPINVRYATDSANMVVWHLHNPSRYAFLATEGPLVLFDYKGSEHLSAHLTMIDEIRSAVSWFYCMAGEDETRRVEVWADELADLVRAHGGGNRRLLVDKCDLPGVRALEARGIVPVAGQGFTEEARRIKHPEEVKAIRRAIHAAEAGMWRMWESLEPGITENEVWAKLHEANVARGGEWIECRILSSGPRTNPWYREASDRVIETGDMVGFDTDLIGPYGYCCDISRSWVTGGRPTPAQSDLMGLAQEQIAVNAERLRPGVTYAEWAIGGFALPEAYRAQRYSCLAHGVGLCDEFPMVLYPEGNDYPGHGGMFEAGMVVSLESYVGAVGGAEGVKLERQVLVTESGVEFLDAFPLGLVPGA